MTDSSLITVVAVLIVFFAAFQQTLSGFGFALITMPLLSFIFGLRVAAPLIALIGLSLFTINLLRYRSKVDLAEVKPLALSAVLGVPFGIWILVHAREGIVKTALGVILIAYALYSAWNPVLLHIRTRHFAVLAGFLSGALGGAYNTSGPPLVVYGSLRHWNPDEFRAMLQLPLFVSATITVTGHVLSHHVTEQVLWLYAAAVPALLFGIFVASRVERFINKKLFRNIVIGMVFLLGLSLILRSVFR
ncbi:MAG TPA: sulfite exporter TauE/SafE family protein [Pseudomonadota bacterium]|nr:sulfite exporter TauE/SafE family protein [Pseudomonadota bacterium]